MVPAGTDAADAKQKMNQTSVGTGPFKLAEFKPNSNMVLVRHDDYWEKGAPISTVSTSSSCPTARRWWLR